MLLFAEYLINLDGYPGSYVVDLLAWTLPAFLFVVNSQPLFRNQEGAPYAVVTSFQDITAAKTVEQALQDARAALNRRLVDSANAKPPSADADAW